MSCAVDIKPPPIVNKAHYLWRYLYISVNIIQKLILLVTVYLYRGYPFGKPHPLINLGKL
nr:MAG TPA: hypothetical protein [Caudoviricetes sp.]